VIESRIEGEQRLLLRLGTKQLGEPDAATRAAIEAIRDIDWPEALGDRIINADIHGWGDLLRAL
jgi:hypothetical protein